MSLKELKHLGHQLLDEYISLDRKRTGKKARNHAYAKLAQKSSKILDYGKVHFANMKERNEVIHAIATLRKMIKSRKHKYTFYKKIYGEKAKTEDVKRAFEEIERKKLSTVGLAQTYERSYNLIRSIFINLFIKNNMSISKLLLIIGVLILLAMSMYHHAHGYIPCVVDQTPLQCQQRLDEVYPNKYEVVFYPQTGLARGERI